MNKGQLFNKIVEKLKLEGVRFCVLRSYQELPHKIYNDVDILFDEKKIEKFNKIVKKNSQENGWVPWLKPAKYSEYHYVIQRYNKEENKIETFSFDAQIDLIEKGIVYKKGKDILKKIISYNNFFILQPEHELNHLLVHAAFGAKNSRTKYIKRIKKLLEEKILYYKPSESWSWPVSFLIKRNLKFNRVKRAVFIARKGYLFFLIKNKSLLFKIKEWLKIQINRIKRRFIAPGLFVVIAGPDGVGKSTTAEILYKIFQGRYIITDHLHFGFRPGILPAKKKNNIKENDFAKENKGIENNNRLIDLFRFIYHSFDYILGYWFKIRPIKNRNGIVVVERYFYDYLIRLDRKKIKLNSNFVKFIFNFFIPKPDIFILLTNTPETIKERREDLSNEEIINQIEKLSYWGNKIDKFYNIETIKNKDEVAFNCAEKIISNFKNE